MTVYGPPGSSTASTHGARANLGIFVLALLLTGFAPTVYAQRAFYRFTPIADTQPQFPYANLTLFPCQNSGGRVAFDALLAGDNHVEGMLSRLGQGGIDTLVDTGLGEWEDFSLDCTVNLNGVVLFRARKKVQDGYASFLMRAGGGVPLLPLICTDASLCTDATFDEFKGWQLNLQAKAVIYAHRASDGANVIATKGSGPLTESQARIIADNRPGSQYADFGIRPTINNSNLVAFVGVRPDQSQVLVSTAQDGTVRNLVDTSGSFSDFLDIDLNNSGSLAFNAFQWGGLSGIWRLDSIGSTPTLTKIVDSTVTGTTDFTAISINDSKQVAYSFSADGGFSTTVGLGNGARFHPIFGLPPIVLGPGATIFNRTVSSAMIGRDSLNNFGQLVMHINFFDGSQMIAVAEPVSPVLNPVVVSGAFALADATGGGAAMSTPVALPSNLLLLTFDATFLSGKGNLEVLLGKTLLKSVPIASRGVRQHIQVPIDLRQKSRRAEPTEAQELRFALSESPGTVVHLQNISIPGSGAHLDRPGLRTRWHFETRKGGWAGYIDDTRFPVQIKVNTPDSKNVEGSRAVTSVAILSTKSFDATRDIQRDTLHYGGIPVLLNSETSQSSEKKQTDNVQCVERDVDGDKRPDLICQFAAPDGNASVSQSKRTIGPHNKILEGLTPYGWMIEGRDQ